MTDILKSYFPRNYETYIEGFGGGASLLFSKEQKGIEIYNDLGENVYSLFKVLSDKELFSQFKEKLDLSFYSEELRNEYKQNLKDELSLLDRAYMFFYVNRTSFNGVGGFSVSSYVRRNMCKSVSDFLSAVDYLPKVHNRLSTVVIEHKDILDLLDKYNHKNIFMYLDPPYCHDTRLSSQKYECEMDNAQHEQMLRKCLESESKIMISGYDSDLYNNILKDWNKVSFDSPNAGSEAVEVIWMNYENNQNALF